jgi:hypothetical protein
VHASMTVGRNRPLIIPREHGAWGILFVPLLAGAAVGLLEGGGGGSLVPFSIVALALFWLRTPAESWAGAASIRARTPREIQLVRNAALLLGMAAAGGLIWLFWEGRNRALVWIGCAAGISFLIQSLVKRRWRSARGITQMVGAAGLTATAPAAYYVVTGNLDATAWSLWAANLLFAINQIHFVQLRIHAAHAANRREKLAIGRRFLIGQTLLVALIIAACAGHVFRWYATLAFMPVLVRGFAWFASPPEPLAIQALGRRELFYACIFGLLLVIGMQLA